MTAADARLSPCPGELAAWLLEPPARSGLLGEMLDGGEHRELIREYFRSRRRGQLVLGSLPGDGRETAPVFAAEIDTAPFVDWYAGQHADAPKPGKFRKQAAETAGFLLDAWGPREHPAEETVSSCSAPRRDARPPGPRRLSPQGRERGPGAAARTPWSGPGPQVAVDRPVPLSGVLRPPSDRPTIPSLDLPCTCHLPTCVTKSSPGRRAARRWRWSHCPGRPARPPPGRGCAARPRCRAGPGDGAGRGRRARASTARRE